MQLSIIWEEKSVGHSKPSPVNPTVHGVKKQMVAGLRATILDIPREQLDLMGIQENEIMDNTTHVKGQRVLDG